jgi:hypothetical protein
MRTTAADMMGFVSVHGQDSRVPQLRLDGLAPLREETRPKACGAAQACLGAVDTELELLRFEEQMKGILTISKQKDGEQGRGSDLRWLR